MGDSVSLKMTVLQTCMVAPASPAGQRRRLFLPGTDIYWRWLPYNQRILFYKIGQQQPTINYTALIDSLKRSLSRVLVEFYPFAGRLVEAGGRLELLCNDAGVEFVEACVDARFQDLQQDNFDMKDYYVKLVTQIEPNYDALKLPLVSVQVTRFLGGDIALGCSHSHVVCDGSSLWHFMVTWAEFARGAEHPSISPIHDRTLLDFRDDLKDLKDDQISFLDVAWRGEYQDKSNGEEVALAMRAFHFSKDMIMQLKRVAMDSYGVAHGRTHVEEGKAYTEGHGMAFSSFEVLCAHVWRHMTRARGVDGNTKLGLIIMGDVRRRLEPQLPIGFVGNAVVARTVLAMASELLIEPFYQSSLRIRDTIMHLTSHSIRKEMACLEDVTKERLAMWSCGFVSMNLASSHTFPIFEVDFGWGAPACVRPPSIGKDGQMIIFAAKHGGVDLCLALQPLHMQNLVNDSQFLSIVS